VNTTVAVRLVTMGPDGRTTVSITPLLPIVCENVYKPFSAYGVNAIDKAVTNAVEYAARPRGRHRTVNADISKTGAEELAPVTRVFGRRLASTRPPGSEVVRVELWVGAAPMPDRGDTEHSVKPPIDSLPLDAALGTVVKNGPASWTLRRLDTSLP
jgi:hypothetical protein